MDGRVLYSVGLVPQAFKKRTFGYFLRVLGGRFISNGKKDKSSQKRTYGSLGKSRFMRLVMYRVRHK